MLSDDAVPWAKSTHVASVAVLVSQWTFMVYAVTPLCLLLAYAALQPPGLIAVACVAVEMSVVPL